MDQAIPDRQLSSPRNIGIGLRGRRHIVAFIVKEALGVYVVCLGPSDPEACRVVLIAAGTSTLPKVRGEKLLDQGLDIW